METTTENTPLAGQKYPIYLTDSAFKFYKITGPDVGIIASNLPGKNSLEEMNAKTVSDAFVKTQENELKECPEQEFKYAFHKSVFMFESIMVTGSKAKFDPRIL